jgi:hypothetical protein
MTPTGPDRGRRTVAIVWYRETDWPRLRTLFADKDELPDTYAEWLATAEALLASLKRSGINGAKVRLDPETFSAWCAAQGLAPDAQARSRYVGEVAAARHRPRH